MVRAIALSQLCLVKLSLLDRTLARDLPSLIKDPASHRRVNDNIEENEAAEPTYNRPASSHAHGSRHRDSDGAAPE
jgi:hypothetical protein